MSQSVESNKENPRIHNDINDERHFILVPLEHKYVENELNQTNIHNVLEAMGFLGILKVQTHQDNANTFRFEFLNIVENKDNTVSFQNKNYDAVSFIKAIHKQKNMLETPEWLMKKIITVWDDYSF